MKFRMLFNGTGWLTMILFVTVKTGALTVANGLRPGRQTIMQNNDCLFIEGALEPPDK